MRSLAAALTLVSILSLAAAPARARGLFLGTNLSLGVSILEEEEGGWLVMGAPAQSGGLTAFQPGLRIGTSLDERRRQSLMLDVGIAYLQHAGHATSSLQVMGSYQYLFTERPVAPYVLAGLGWNGLTTTGSASSPPVLGAGIGLRRALANGHGALRAEGRVDRQFEVRHGDNLTAPAATCVTLRLGFDLLLD